MPQKNFTSRRQWHNTLVMVWAAPFLLLIGLLVLAIAGHVEGLAIVGAILIAGLGLALMRDMRAISHYTVRSDKIVLESKNARFEIAAHELIDASLIDRAAAREYIREHLNALGAITRAQRRKAEQESSRFCSIDIGLGSWTFGIMRRLIDRLPVARYDLVLLRLRNGKALLISPRYTQDLVDAVGRMIAAHRS